MARRICNIRRVLRVVISRASLVVSILRFFFFFFFTLHYDAIFDACELGAWKKRIGHRARATGKLAAAKKGSSGVTFASLTSASYGDFAATMKSSPVSSKCFTDPFVNPPMTRLDFCNVTARCGCTPRLFPAHILSSGYELQTFAVSE